MESINQKKIINDLLLLEDIQNDLNSFLIKQGEDLNRIENNIINSENNIVLSKDNLKEANYYRIGYKPIIIGSVLGLVSGGVLFPYSALFNISGVILGGYCGYEFKKKYYLK